MAYTSINFPTKKALKAAVSRGDRVYLQGEFLPQANVTEGIAFIEGPHYPKPHTWYAKVKVTRGIITKVLS